MNIFSWLQLIFYMVVLIALAKPLGAFMARVYQGERTFLDPVMRPVEKLIYRLCGVQPDEEMNWKVYAIASDALQCPGAAGGIRLAAPAGFPAAQPAGLRRGLPGFVLEHRGQLCHQHQLAGLRRRDHHELPDPDAGADHPELPLGSHRHGRPDCHDPRNCAPHRQNHRQLLGGSHPYGALHPPAAGLCPVPGARFPGRGADLQPV